MRQTDFDEFTRQCSVLCAGFNVPATPERIDAYWRGLQKMDVLVFARVVEHALGQGGPERIPTVPQLWNLQRAMRSRPAPQMAEPEREYDSLHCFAQRCLLRWLMENGPVGDEMLPRLVAEKNRLLEQFRVIAAEEKLTADDVRPAMLQGFDRTVRSYAA
jgi:hypothetical protein